MADYDGRSTLLSEAQAYGRSDEEAYVSGQRSFQRKEEKPSKAVMYLLAGVTFLFLLFIIIGALFLAKPLEARLSSVGVRNLRYGNSSSSPFINATFVAALTIKNPNWGAFQFSNTTADFTYDDDTIGQVRIHGGRVNSTATITVPLTVDVRHGGNEKSKRLKEDIRYKILLIKSHAEVKGKVKLKAESERTAKLRCLMYLNLDKEDIQHLRCR